MNVIGNGMLAKAFLAVDGGYDELVFFCSGVSDSGTTSAYEFEREESLLSESIGRHSDRKTIYFSSCAAGAIDSPYYRHKQAMERLVESSAKRYLIARLPQVVGVTKNATLVNFIAGNIKSGKPITVFRGARRNLIDVDDVVRLTLYLAQLDNMAINVTNSNMVSVDEIVKLISGILGESPIVQAGPPEAAGQAYDGRQLKELLGPNDPIYSVGYNQAVLSKYVPLLCD
jgi:nucleoside-diphosphate-sugar epimerase